MSPATVGAFKHDLTCLLRPSIIHSSLRSLSIELTSHQDDLISLLFLSFPSPSSSLPLPPSSAYSNQFILFSLSVNVSATLLLQFLLSAHSFILLATRLPFLAPYPILHPHSYSKAKRKSCNKQVPYPLYLSRLNDTILQTTTLPCTALS